MIGAIKGAILALRAVRSSSPRCSRPARMSLSRSPRSLSARREPGSPATSLCRVASWSTCPRSITPGYRAKSSPPKIARGFAVSSVKPAAPIPAASSCAPPQAAPPMTRLELTSSSLARPGTKLRNAASSARLPPCSTATSTSSSASSAITSATISPAFGLTMKRSTARSLNSSAASSPSSLTR